MSSEEHFLDPMFTKEIPEKMKEVVLCIPTKREWLFNLEDIKQESLALMPRWMVEEDESWQQLIPYVVLMKNGTVLVYQRYSDSDRELADAYSIGVGGHINLKDVWFDNKDKIDLNRTIINNISRELKEELKHNIYIPSVINSSIIGFIQKDDGIGKFHTAIVIKLQSGGNEQPNSEEIESCEYMLVEDAKKIEGLESWSELVLDAML